MIVIDGPSEAVVGEQVVLDASNSFDYDGDPITYIWSQLHNPDRYAGNEYVTGNEVSLESADTAVTSFVAQWPGRYRFAVSAIDEDGETVEIQDVEVRATEDIFAIRGMAIDGRNGPWSERTVVEMLSYLSDLGFNYIQVGIHDTQDSPTSSEILIDRCRENWVLTLEQNIRLIDMAHERGFGVMLFPHLACSIDGDWYEGFNISPSDPHAWLESYSDYAVFYAELAEEHSVEILNLGGGLFQFHRYSSEWGQILDEVRQRFGGEVAFSWFHFPPWPEEPAFPQVAELDILVNAFNWNGSGVSFTGNLMGNKHPSVSQMVRHFDFELGQYLDVLQAQYRKSIIATDLYAWPVDGMNINTPAVYSTDERPLDNQEPIDYAEAAFRTMAERGWDGVFFWALKVGPPAPWEPDIRGNPIEQMLEIWFLPQQES